MGALVCAQSMGATYIMLGVLPYQGSTPIEQALLVLFAVLFAWISLGFWMAAYGFVLRRLGGDPLSLLARYPARWLDACPLAPTAIIFPIYHEEIERTFAGIRATYRDLAATGHLEAFELFVLSDSRDPDIWLAEQEAWYRLCESLNAHGRLHYRRRPINLNRKTGNIADFLRRWGRRFTYMIVMDADSLIAGADLLRMVQLAQAAPQVGIVQTSPKIVNANTAYARLQQFANRIYGPLFTTGLAALGLGDAAFWGHNAILRVAPFMQTCALRRLRGWGFLRGTVLSHDFVEASYMRRAGLEVWLEPGLSASYEESPPTLVDDLARDRRWCRGNLQHLYFLVRRKTRFAYRIVFANGIMSYLASPLWLLFLAVSTAEVTRFVLWPVDYFPSPYQLHPLWPQWQPQWALRLVFSILFILFTPKILAITDLALDRRTLGAVGGLGRALASVLLEFLLAMLLAPIRMLSHSLYVIETLLNLGVSWAGQNRTHELGWRDALLHHAPGSALASAWAGFSWWLKPAFALWSVPIALPLIFAAPIAVWLSRFRSGIALRRWSLLRTPEEDSKPPILSELTHPVLRHSGGLSPFEAAVLDPWRNDLHQRLARSRDDRGGRGRLRDDMVGRCIEQGPYVLSPAERHWLAQDRTALIRLHGAAWNAAPNTYWDGCIGRLCQTDPADLNQAEPQRHAAEAAMTHQAAPR